MKNLLVPIDYSSSSGHVLDVAGALAKALGAQVHLIHVRELDPVPPVAGLAYGGVGMPELLETSGISGPIIAPTGGTFAATDKGEIRKWQEQLALAGVKAVFHEPTGAIVDEILVKADAVNADLIVMGRHGHGAMYNLLVGSVTEGVLKRATCPVLLVPYIRG